MNPFLSALEEGHAPEEILKYIARAIPNLSEPIRKATKAGYSLQNIIGFLSKKFNTEDRRGLSESERHGANAREDAARTKYGLKMAATAVAAPIAVGAARHALSRALPTSLTSLLNPGTSPIQSPQNGEQNGLPNNPSGLNPLQSASAPTSQMPPQQGQVSSISQQPPGLQSTISQQPQAVQPETININATEILSKHGIKEKVDDILRSKNNPESVSAFFEKFNPKAQKAIEKETGMPFQKIIEEYSKQAPAEQEIAPEAEEIEPEEPKINKDSFVATPHGLGEVKSIKEKSALVNVDGELKKVPIEEIEDVPLPAKDLAELLQDLNAGVEKETGEEISRMVNFAGYDPKHNELSFKPHIGPSYTYTDISPEDTQLLTSILNQRKTTGENFIGAWNEGSKSPIGAAMSALIKKLQAQAGGKGKEYSRKYEPVYEAHGPAYQALKKKKDEERKKKKRS